MSPFALSLRFLQTQPDGRLVELARDGHERAFEALVRRYRGPLLAYCRRVAPRGTPPEDILQQGLLQAWRALGAGAEVRDPRAWLYRIVHNVAITALRTSGELPHGVLADPRAPAADQVVEQRMAARDALAGLAALPELQRQVMVSTALDGDSHEEIAAALGLTSGSVRGLIYRARSTLRAAAAALVPAPLIDWAVGDAGSGSAGLAGSAGVGALIAKGGAIVAVGAIAGTTAIVVAHHTQRAGPARAAQTAVSSNAGGAGRSTRADQTGQTGGARAVVASTIGAAGAARGGREGAGSRTPGQREGQRRDRSSGGGSPSSTRHDDSGAGSAFGRTGGGGRGDGSSTGSDGGGSRPVRTGSSGGDGSAPSSGSSGGAAGGDGTGDRVDGGEQHGQGSGSGGGGDSPGSSSGGISGGVHDDGGSDGSSHGGGPGDDSGSSSGSGVLPTPTISSSPEG